MGVVYKCHDTVLDRVVAIKQMVGELDDDHALRARFTQEARAAARLNHPHIITIYELHESDTDLAIVMELLEGVDLATLIKHKAPLTLDARLNLMAQVCDGLDYAHKAGIVHRDIKPANLHVSPTGVVKILDFGIARMAASKMTSTGGIIGTPDYMSPEQVMSATIDARSDVFAVGAVLYELLSGAKPFAAGSITALLMKIMREPHEPLSERVPDLPQGVIDLVDRLLAKPPEDRPASAREVHAALLALATERPLFDAQTVSTLSRAVTEETLRPRTPQPASRKSVRSVPAARDASSAKLASLALDQGRSLRRTGDLAGAMKVFRSVLELAPGNPEALGELEEVERAVASLTASPRADSSPLHAGVAAAAASQEFSGEPPNATRSSVGPMLVAAGAILLLAVGAGAYFLLARDATPPVAQTVAVPPAAAVSPPAAPATAPAPPQPAAPLPAVNPDAIATPQTQAAPIASPPPAASPRAAPSGAASTRAAERVPSAPPSPPPPAPSAPEPSPPIAATPEPVATPLPPPPAPEPPVATADVRHYHGRSLRRGFSRGYCDGTLQLLPDGLYFRTTSSSDGRRDDRRITFGEIEDVEIDDDRLFIEGEEQNWEFGGGRDLLQRIREHIRSNKKGDPIRF